MYQDARVPFFFTPLLGCSPLDHAGLTALPKPGTSKSSDRAHRAPIFCGPTWSTPSLIPLASAGSMCPCFSAAVHRRSLCFKIYPSLTRTRGTIKSKLNLHCTSYCFMLFRLNVLLKGSNLLKHRRVGWTGISLSASNSFLG